MRVLRMATHGLVLLLADMAGIIIGFLVYHLTRPRSQLAVQVPVAGVVALVLFLVWLALSRHARWLRFQRDDPIEWTGMLVASLAWGPLIFVPAHFVTQGYPTSAGNLVALPVFQIPINSLTLLLAWSCRREPPSEG